MDTSPNPQRLRVLVTADHALVAETVRVALTNRGHDVVVMSWSADARDSLELQTAAGGTSRERLTVVGLMICDLDRWSRIDAAASLVARVNVPWLALTGARRGPVWGALLAAGVEMVAPRDTGLEQISELLMSVGQRRPLTSADESKALQTAWQETRAHHRLVADRVGRLSTREREVLRQLYEGRSVARIAGTLGVAPTTVRRQVKALQHKLDARTKLAAIAAFGESLDEFDT